MTTRVLRRAGFAVMALSTCIAVIFVVGETVTDPGGWKAAGLIAAWAVPLAVLAGLAWYRPGWMEPACVVLTGALIGVAIWFTVSPVGKGPTEDILIFALAAVIAVLGLNRTAVAGALLLVAGIVPVAISSFGRGHGPGSLTLVSVAPVISGILYLLAANSKNARAAPSEPTDSGSGKLPTAA